MKYFIEETTQVVFAFAADGSQDSYITATMRPMNADEVAAHTTPKQPSAYDNKSEARRRLSDTDWVNQPDVLDTKDSPHLANRDDFVGYRAKLRAICVRPVDGDLVWPSQPDAVWVY